MITKLKYLILIVLCFAGVFSVSGVKILPGVDKNRVYWQCVKSGKYSVLIAKTPGTANISIPEVLLVYAAQLPVVGLYDSALKDEAGVESVSLHKNVTSIGNYAFYGCTNLKTVASIPSELNFMGVAIFEGCTRLKSIDLKNTALTELADHTFLSCSSMTDIKLPSKLQKIGQATFAHCHGLTKIEIPNTLTTLRNRAFLDCQYLTEIDLSGTTIPSIEYSTFENCVRLEKVSLPETVTAIYENAFYKCWGLKSITIPNKVTRIYQNAFRDCNNLTSVNIPDGVTRIDKYAFGNCRFSSITLPDSCVRLASYTFCDNPNLKSITIPPDVEYLYQHVFSSCTSLATVKLNEGLRVIANDAFNNCTSLTTIDIPAGVTTIEPNAFLKCHNLKTAYIYADRESIKIYDDAFPKTTEIIWVSDYEYYQNGDGITITDGPDFTGDLFIPSLIEGLPVTEIAAGAFTGSKNITGVHLSDAITSVGANAFSGCTGIKEVTLGKHITSIKAGTFEGCSNLEKITMKGSITSVGAKAFHGCSKLKAFPIIGDDLKIIGASAFEGCESLTELELPRSVTSIGVEAFNDCTGLKSVLIYAIQQGNGAVTVGDDAFPSTCEVIYSGVAYLSNGDGTLTITGCITGNDDYSTDLVIPKTICGETVVAIKDGAFRTEALTSLTMPDTITTIGINVFDHCGLLTNVVLSANLQSIPAKTFEGCTSLKNITLPSGIQSIGASAFNQCSALESIVIPDTVTEIGSAAFHQCTKLTEVKIHAASDQIKIADNAFQINTNVDVEPVYVIESGWDYEELPDGTSISIKGITRAVGSIEIPETIDGYTVTEIGESAFSGRTSLTHIIFPDTLTSIGSEAFANCTGLTSVVIPANVKTILSSAFRGCTGITSVTLPEGLSTLGTYAFSGCTKLEQVTIPSTLVTIEEGVFSDCTSLGSVTFQEGLKEIKSGAFANTALTSVTLPSSIETVAEDAFPEGCVINYTTAWSYTTADGNATITGVKHAPLNLEVPATFENNTVTGIVANAFTDLYIISLLIPDGVTVDKLVLNVGVRVTHGEWIYEIFDDDSITICAAVDGTPLSDLTLPTTYDGYTVKQPEETEPDPPGGSGTIEIPEPPEVGFELGEHFSIIEPYFWVYNIDEVVVSDGSGNTPYKTETNVTINAFCLTDETGTISDLTIPDKFDGFPVVAIGEGAFTNECASMTSVAFPSTLAEIKANAFQGCTNLTEVLLPSGITPDQVADSAFPSTTRVFYQMSKTVTDATTGASATWNYHWSKEGAILKSYSTTSDIVLVPTKLNGAPVEPLPPNYFPASMKVQHDPWIYTVLEDGTSIKIEKGSDSTDNFTIPETIDYYTVTAIGNMAFGLEKPFEADVLISSLTLPATLKEIYAYSFYKQIALETISIPTNVTSIAANAFGGCENLKKAIFAVIEEDVTVSDNAFPEDCELIFLSAAKDEATGVTWAYTENEDKSVELDYVKPNETTRLTVSGRTTFASTNDLKIINTALKKAVAAYPTATSVQIATDAALGATEEEIAENLELLFDLGVEPSYELVDGVLVMTFKLPTIQIASFSWVEEEVEDEFDPFLVVTNKIGTFNVKIIPAAGGAISSQANTTSVKGCIHIFGTAALDQEFVELPSVEFDLTSYLKTETPGEMTLTVDLDPTYQFFKVTAGEVSSETKPDATPEP